MAHKHTRHRPKERENPDWPQEQSKLASYKWTRAQEREERHRQRGLKLGAAILFPQYGAETMIKGPHGIAKVRPRDGVALTARERRANRDDALARSEKLRAIRRQWPNPLT